MHDGIQGFLWRRPHKSTRDLDRIGLIEGISAIFFVIFIGLIFFMLSAIVGMKDKKASFDKDNEFI